MQNPLQQIQQPDAAAPSAAEPAFFVMSEEYRHGAVGKKMAQPHVEPPKLAAVVAAPILPRPAVAAKPLAAKKKMSRQTKALLIAGAILVGGLAVGAAVILFSMRTPEVKTPEKPVATRPAPVAETPKPADTKPAPATETPATASPFPAAAVPGTDSDSDGLTDLEEKLVYQTNSKLPDSDSDGFLDGNEVFHRYNPGGTAPGTLLESGLVKQAAAAAYRVLYPSVWAFADGTIVATTGEAIVLTTTDLEGKTFAEWFAAQKFSKDFSTSKTKNGYAEHVEEGGLMELIETGDGHVVSLRYDARAKASVDYLQTFKMMVNSFEWL